MIAKTLFFGDAGASLQLVQLTGGDEEGFLASEFDQICHVSGRTDLGLTAVLVSDWNQDLSPWAAPAVFGDEGFGSGAGQTLQSVLTDIVPKIRETAGEEAALYLGGYSLAGLFSLWAGTQTDVFSGIAAVSPSVWFPGFTDHLKEYPMKVRSVYLSLGTKEEKTRNPVMRTVGDAIRLTKEILTAAGLKTELEWNPGNHFKEPDLRTAKGFAWLLR